MALWLARAGKHGEHEDKFLQEGRLYLTWWNLDADLSHAKDAQAILEILQEKYSSDPINRLKQYSRQINFFVNQFQVGDWIATPSRFAPVIHFGKIKGGYAHDGGAENPYYHWREVEWFCKDFPKSKIDQDLLYSLGAFSTICRISRNDAENRIHAVVAGRPILPNPLDDGIDESNADLEIASREQIANRIIARFQGHGLAELIEEILKARGYVVYRSPKGADGGIDLLASTGSLGFDEPKIAVQVKSQQSQVTSNVLSELKGAMTDVGATHGLLVAWDGFKNSYDGHVRRQNFFRIRFWTREEIIDEICELYELLPERIRAELPLKQIWTLASEN